ncbi:type IV secretory system conjugative DNA transfer family protein [Candidatus Peribacteria bacterium]|nr:type IV secretory system conjugative DNA transfer family protein [Candidatus Peribacteria bacterium]
MRETYLIQVPPNNQKKEVAFAEILNQLHETLVGQTFSLEIVTMSGNLGFVFTADPGTCQVLMGQFYAVFPAAEILQIPDYTTLLPQGMPIAGADVTLTRNAIYPINTHQNFDGDSLAGLLSVMSKTKPEEGVWFQLVCTPVPDSGFFHWKMGIVRMLDTFRHKFRIKYWFKKQDRNLFSQSITSKLQSRLYRVSLRVAAFGPTMGGAATRLSAMLSTLKNYNTLDLNSIKPAQKYKGAAAVQAFAKRSHPSLLLSSDEIATLYHLPNEREVSNIIQVISRKGEAPPGLPTDTHDSDISFFGKTNFHGSSVPFGIKRSDRRRHLYVVGKSGSGKSKLIELLIQADLQAGKGVGVLDPHGDLVDNVLRMVPEHRQKDVVLIDPTDIAFPIAFNPIENVKPELKIRVTTGFLEIFEKLFGAGWNDRLEHVLRMTTLALLDSDGTTVLSIMRMLTDKNYRQDIVRNIQDDTVKSFWVNEFAGWSEKFDNQAITPLLNKVGQFLASNMIRNIVGQPHNKFNIREVMDGQKILLVKVSKGILGEENAQLLGAIIVTKIYQAAMERADTLEENRRDFYFYVDEFQNFATDTFDEIMSEARKYRLCLTIAHQFLGQLTPQILKTVFGNVGSMITFRVGGDDAQILEKELQPKFTARDIINLGVRDFYTKMSIEGDLKEAFSGRTLTIHYPEKNCAKEIREHSRKTYAMPKRDAEAQIKAWEDGSLEQQDENFHEPII